MSDEYGRHERHHHRRENEEEFDAPPRRRSDESEYGYERPPRRNEESEYGYQQPPRRHSEYEGEGDGYGDRPPRRHEGGYSEGGYSDEGRYGGGRPVVETATYQQTYETDQGIATSRTEVTKHKREEEVAGVGGLAAGAFAVYESYEAKKDPQNAARHKLEAEVAGAGALGAGGFALYERHEKKQSEEQLDNYEDKLTQQSGEKKHGWFG